MERSVRLGRSITRIRSDKMEKVASRRGSAGTGRSFSTRFLLIARSNEERNPCLLRCFPYAEVIYIRTVTPLGKAQASLVMA